jgi:hypothetical protein
MSLSIRINKHIELERAVLFFSDDKVFIYSKKVFWNNSGNPVFMQMKIDEEMEDMIYWEDYQNRKYVWVTRSKKNPKPNYESREIDVVELKDITPYLQYII